MNKFEKSVFGEALRIINEQEKEDNKKADAFSVGSADKNYYQGRASGHRISAMTLKNAIDWCEKLQ